MVPPRVRKDTTVTSRVVKVSVPEGTQFLELRIERTKVEVSPLASLTVTHVYRSFLPFITGSHSLTVSRYIPLSGEVTLIHCPGRPSRVSLRARYGSRL